MSNSRPRRCINNTAVFITENLGAYFGCRVSTKRQDVLKYVTHTDCARILQSSLSLLGHNAGTRLLKRLSMKES